MSSVFLCYVQFIGQLHHKYEQLAEQTGDGTRGLDLEGDVALDTLTDGAVRY